MVFFRISSDVPAFTIPVFAGDFELAYMNVLKISRYSNSNFAHPIVIH